MAKTLNILKQDNYDNILLAVNYFSDTALNYDKIKMEIKIKHAKALNLKKDDVLAISISKA